MGPTEYNINNRTGTEIFHPSKRTKILTDASRDVSGVLLQADGNHCKLCLSKAVTASDHDYTKIKKKSLGLVYGIKKF